MTAAPVDHRAGRGRDREEGVTASLAKFVAKTTLADLEPGVVMAAKVAILDGLANLVAGSRQPVAEVLSSYAHQLGGTPRSSIIGGAVRTSPTEAAFVNGAVLHCLDFEIQGFPPAHGTSCILPPALALAEMSGASGASVIEAFVVGWELQSRVRAAAPATQARQLHPIGIFGPLGSAASSAHILGLTTEQVQIALGTAASRTGGLFATNGTMGKATIAGNAARAGVEAALLARAGFTSCTNVLEADRGYIDSLFDGNFQWDGLTEGLYSRFLLSEPGFNVKRYPAQIYCQWVIEAVLGLQQSAELRGGRWSRLTLKIPDVAVPISRPAPASGSEGRFSVQYCAAVAISRGRVGLESFTDEVRFAPDVVDALGKIEVQVDPSIPKSLSELWVDADVVYSHGATEHSRCASYRGSKANPMTNGELVSKVRDCAGDSLSSREVDRLSEIVLSLDSEPGVEEMMQILRNVHQPLSQN